jgi:hypothetical protein
MIPFLRLSREKALIEVRARPVARGWSSTGRTDRLL